MPHFFPRHTIEWKLQEPPVVRRLSLSLVAMGMLTGVAVHLYRWLVLSYRPLNWSLFFFLSFGAGLVLLLGLTTAFLANYPVRQWLWRAPLFALVVSFTEAIVSAILIAAGIERYGTRAAAWADWLPLSRAVFFWRTLIILLFALLLAAVVQWIRLALVKGERARSGS